MYRDTLGEAAWVRHQISRLVGCAKGNKSPKGGLAHLASRLVLAVSLTIRRVVRGVVGVVRAPIFQVLFHKT